MRNSTTSANPVDQEKKIILRNDEDNIQAKYKMR
jgi:hypothetical protein